MSDDYDSRRDATLSYYAAVKAKKDRGDTYFRRPVDKGESDGFIAEPVVREPRIAAE